MGWGVRRRCLQKCRGDGGGWVGQTVLVNGTRGGQQAIPVERWTCRDGGYRQMQWGGGNTWRVMPTAGP